MNELKDISNSFETTIRDSDLRDVTIDLAETFTDSFLNDGIVRDIPIINTILGLSKTTMKIKENILLKKIIYFISELNEIPIEKRKEVITKIDSSKNYRIKVGEKLLYIIDKCDDHDKAQTVARLFSAFIEGTIDYNIFLRASCVIDRIISEDLHWFVQSDFEELELEKAGDFINSGLFELSPISISVDDQWDYTQLNKYIVEGDEIKARVSLVGKMIRQILKKY